MRKYVAGVIVVFILDTKQVKWTAQQDMAIVKFRAYAYSSPTVVDLDGDGNLDILVGTCYGLFYVLDHKGAWPLLGPCPIGEYIRLRGKDGSIARPYPYRTHGRLMNQVLLVDLSKRGEKKKVLTFVTTLSGTASSAYQFEGAVDEGNKGPILLDTFPRQPGRILDFNNADTVVDRYHRFKAWRAHNQGHNNVANPFNREGIYILPSSRAFRDEEGKSFWVEIEIVDRHRVPSGSQVPYKGTVDVNASYLGEVINKVETTVRLSSATLRAFSCSGSAWLKMLFYANKAVSINEADFWEKSYLLRQKLLVPQLAYLRITRRKWQEENPSLCLAQYKENTKSIETFKVKALLQSIASVTG
ncbi:hypothetical protein RHMOL_Rhmol10G0122100 [Rhododendron molle]|uniref:Uncharacterized protein n=1 Tax=Rhododendron molle TaxID=49168 RepID=A0ACC0M345_RHOML|nr:hypothetical protein RHMOL_Rhmol10G0122100 [Rhododendron molle]